MNLCLIRHAHAVRLDPPELEVDEDRPLSDEGRRQLATLAAALRSQAITFDHVLSSPLLRAKQTAEGMVQLLGRDPSTVEPTNELAPGGGRKKLAKLLRRLSGERVALVGHQPVLGDFAAWLIGGKSAQVEFAKAGMAWITCDAPPRKGAGRLEWLVTPEWYANERPARDRVETSTAS
jgi:phosphohistidine phosphatase